MRANLDDPISTTRVDPLCFFVRGWVWLESAHDAIVAVEAWAGDACIGETTALTDRPDVRASLTLPLATCNGFELFVHHSTVAPGASVEVSVRARFRDGTRSAPLASTTVATI